MPTNVLGTELKCCCQRSDDWILPRRILPNRTGGYRASYGLRESHAGISRFLVLDGNDLVTPHPEWGFPGLKPGDKWCVCVTRWKSALDHNRAAPVDLEATHASALEFVTLEELKAYAALTSSARG